MQHNNKYETPVPTFRETAIGLIPVDWEVKRIGSVCDFIVPGRNKPKLFEGNIPWITTPDLFNKNEVFISKIGLFISESEAKNIGSKIVPKGSIIMSCVGELGILAIAGTDLVINQQLHAFLPNIFINTNYVIYALKLQTKHIEKVATKTAVPYLNKDNCNSIPIPIPPLPEQQKIATILSTWDVAIHNCKTIIEKIQLRNKGLAQQLLTGKMRSKGFEGTKWKVISINKIAKEISLKNPSDKELIVMSCTKYNGLVPSLEYFGRKIYSDDLTTYKIVKKGQFAYATNHIEEGSIGYQSIYEEALISPMYTVFQTNETLNDNLLFRILKSHKYIHEYQRRMEGSIDRRGGLRWDEFSKIKIPIFELEEQEGILNILNTASTELTQYQQKLQALQLQKKGLMQQLLTGKVRVRV
jgi:type I restriction enzyme, S subunit